MLMLVKFSWENHYMFIIIHVTGGLVILEVWYEE